MKRIFLCSLLSCFSIGQIVGAASSSRVPDYIPLLPSLQLLCTNALMEGEVGSLPPHSSSQALAVVDRIPAVEQDLRAVIGHFMDLDDVVRCDGRTHGRHVDLVVERYERRWRNFYERAGSSALIIIGAPGFIWSRNKDFAAKYSAIDA